jgi:anti-sigma factor RsiW
MPDRSLVRHLRTLSRTVLMLQTELRHGRLDAELLADIDRRMEQGIATDPRCAALLPAVDALRESTLTPRPELLGDTVRACEKLRDAIDAVIGQLG